MKTFFRVIIGIVLCLVLTVVAVSTLIDPNRLKPEIEKQLAAQQLFLQLNGDISWQFFPSFGIDMERAVLFDAPNTDAASEILAKVDALSFGVQVMPLFSGKIYVDDVSLSGVAVNMTTYADGSTNWDQVIAPDPDGEDESVAAPDAEASEAVVPELDIGRILISDIVLTLVDEQVASTTVIDIEEIALLDVNLAGVPMSLTAKVNYTATGLPPVAVDAAATLRLDLESNKAELDALTVFAATTNGADIRIDAASHVELAPLVVSGSVSVISNSLQKWLAALDIELPPDTLQPDAIRRFNLNLAFSATQNTAQPEQLSASLTNVVVALDDTQFDGHVEIELDTAKPLPAVTTRWHSTLVDLNAFLLPPPEAPEDAQTEPLATSDVVLEPVAVPMQLLRDLVLSATLTIDQVLYQTLPVTDVVVDAVASDGVISVNSVQANIEEGQFAAEATMDARGDALKIEASAVSDQLDLGYIATHLAQVKQVGGYLNANVQAKTVGVTDLELTENLYAVAEADSPELRVIPINLIKMVCQAGALLEQKPMPEHSWNAYTDLTPLNLKLELNKGIAQLQQLTASVEQFNASATGSYNTVSGDFEIPVQLKLADMTAQVPECNYINKAVRDIAIPLMCKGNAESVGIDTCLPDRDILKNLAKQRINQEVDKQKQKLGEKADELIKDKLGEEAGGILKGLFN